MVSKRLAGVRGSFPDLGMGETAALSPSKGMRGASLPAIASLRRGGRDSPVNKSLKGPAREPRNERKDFMAFPCFSAT
jgi:hypothetical protein